MRIPKLTKRISKSGGRNNQGVITVFHRGGGNAKLYRIIDYKRTLFDVPAVVVKLEYGYRHNCSIALVCYKNGMLSYIPASAHLKPGDIVCSGPRVEPIPGNALPMGYIPVGTAVHNIELKPGRGGQLMRAAGTYARIVHNSSTTATLRGTVIFGDTVVRLRNGKLYGLSTQAMATVGIMSEHNKPLRKAGESRWRGRRPVVRGVAMNPIDHPHGGGEGRSKGGRHPVTPWGKLTKGWKSPTARKKLAIRIRRSRKSSRKDSKSNLSK